MPRRRRDLDRGAEPVALFFTLLCDAVAAKSRHQDVGVLLSGGIDSLSVTLALQKLGKTIHAYTYHIEGYPSQDLAKAEATAKHFNWPLTVITVPVAGVADDFVRLAVQHRCPKENALRGAVPDPAHLPGDRRNPRSFTGWNANDPYGNTRKRNIHYASMVRERC